MPFKFEYELINLTKTVCSVIQGEAVVWFIKSEGVILPITGKNLCLFFSRCFVWFKYNEHLSSCDYV